MLLIRKRVRAAGVLSFAFVEISIAQAQITRISSFEYDARGQLTQIAIEPDDSQSCLAITQTYDTFGHASSTRRGACPGANGDAVASAAQSRTVSID